MEIVVANGIPKTPPKWCLLKINSNFEINKKTGVIRWKIDYRQMKKGSIVGSPNSKGYIRVRLYSSEYGMKHLLGHHVAWYMYYGEWPKSRIDHKDGDEGNNSKNNIRKATQQQNRQNSKENSNNKIGIKGVRKCSYKTANGEKVYYRAQICVNNKTLSLGTFQTVEEAKKARVLAEDMYFKEFSFNKRIK